MADELNENAEKAGTSPFIKYTLVLLGVILVSASVGLAVYKFLVKPMFNTPQIAAAPEDEIPPFPAGMATVDFDDMYITVQTEDPDLVSPLLVTQVALSCVDQATVDVVMAKKQYFAAEILNLHQGRTRAELNDALVRNSILEQIKQRANYLLKRLAPNQDLTILNAMHLKFAIMDLG